MTSNLSRTFLSHSVRPSSSGSSEVSSALRKTSQGKHEMSPSSDGSPMTNLPCRDRVNVTTCPAEFKWWARSWTMQRTYVPPETVILRTNAVGFSFALGTSALSWRDISSTLFKAFSMAFFSSWLSDSLGQLKSWFCPFHSTSSRACTVTCRFSIGRGSDIPFRAYSCRGFPSIFSAEKLSNNISVGFSLHKAWIYLSHWRGLQNLTSELG